MVTIIESCGFGDFLDGHMRVLGQEDCCPVESHLFVESLGADSGLGFEESNEGIGCQMQELGKFTVWDMSMDVGLHMADGDLNTLVKYEVFEDVGGDLAERSHQDFSSRELGNGVPLCRGIGDDTFDMRRGCQFEDPVAHEIPGQAKVEMAVEVVKRGIQETVAWCVGRDEQQRLLRQVINCFTHLDGTTRAIVPPESPERETGVFPAPMLDQTKLEQVYVGVE